MKKRLISLLAVVLLAGGTSLYTSGCSSYPTGKSTGEYIDDAAITAKVKAAMIRDPIVKALQVNVDTYKGMVQLNGFVDTAEQRMRAEQIARTVPGITGVQNQLTVKGQVPAGQPATQPMR